MKMRTTAGLETLDKLSTGVLLVDRESHVVFANRQARAMLNTANGLSMKDGVVIATTAEHTVALHETVIATNQTRETEKQSMSGSLFLPRTSPKCPLSVVVTPLEEQAVDLDRGSAIAAIFITDPERELRPPEEILIQLYGLTKSEASLALKVIQGLGLQHAADDLGVSINTARTHLKRIFHKTGTSRQAELVKLLLSGIPPITLE